MIHNISRFIAALALLATAQPKQGRRHPAATGTTG